MNSGSGRVFVEAPARLHFGVLDLAGVRGRSFGGIGAGAPVPPLRLSACKDASEVSCGGDDAARVITFARHFFNHHGITGGVRFHVHHSLPRHTGLGSGTQLALSVARALAELYGLDAGVESLAAAVGRTRRSAVGMWMFAGGGFVLEGGRREHSPVAPLLARIAFPETWRCIVAVPQGRPGISGLAEESAFDRLPAPPAGEAEQVAHIVLMGLLPALAEGDLHVFGASLAEIQQITGSWFAPVQGGPFSASSRAAIDALRDLGAHGVGQSSWGPAVYGIVAGDDQATAVSSALRTGLGKDCEVFSGAFPVSGARVWRDP